MIHIYKSFFCFILFILGASISSCDYSHEGAIVELEITVEFFPDLPNVDYNNVSQYVDSISILAQEFDNSIIKYRAFTNSEGKALLRLPIGRYNIEAKKTDIKLPGISGTYSISGMMQAIQSVKKNEKLVMKIVLSEQK